MSRRAASFLSVLLLLSLAFFEKPILVVGLLRNLVPKARRSSYAVEVSQWHVRHSLQSKSNEVNFVARDVVAVLVCTLH